MGSRRFLFLLGKGNEDKKLAVLDGERADLSLQSQFVSLEKEVEIGGGGGRRERAVEEKLEVLDGCGGSDGKNDGFAG